MTPFPIDSRKPDSPFLERLRNGVTRCHPSPAEPTRGAKVEGAIVCSRARTRTRGSEAIRSHHRPLRRRALPGSRRRSPLSSACPSVDQVRPAAPPPHGEGGEARRRPGAPHVSGRLTRQRPSSSIGWTKCQVDKSPYALRRRLEARHHAVVSGTWESLRSFCPRFPAICGAFSAGVGHPYPLEISRAP